MRKRIISDQAASGTRPRVPRLPLEAIDEVEVTSEAPGFPIEAALAADPPAAVGGGWRAGAPGPQVIRLHFAHPVGIAGIHLRFEETERTRTQQFTLRWSGAGGATPQEIVRQQFNFAPPGGATREEEDFHVHLTGVQSLELTIVPDIGGGTAIASLGAWWVDLASS